jgi:Zn finger protein HypA/HybF involved in hydrogenase expression
MKKLLRTETSTIFKARTRIMEAKINVKTNTSKIKCRICEDPNETQDTGNMSRPPYH